MGMKALTILSIICSLRHRKSAFMFSKQKSLCLSLNELLHVYYKQKMDT